MNVSISSTEAVRNFSELLNKIRYRGESYTVVRGGKPVAALVPVESSRSVITLADLREILPKLPSLDHNDHTFAADVGAAAKVQPAVPEVHPWE